MIPTRYRAKLAEDLSYPVKAGEISEALSGVPHVEALSVSFHSTAGGSASRFRRVLAAGSPYTILRAVYCPARKPGLGAAAFMIEAGWYDERWELTVYPVLRARRSVANRLLRDQGLPALRRWLQTAPGMSKGLTVQWMDLVSSPTDESLVANEGRQYQSSRV